MKQFKQIKDILVMALKEDIGSGDVTTETLILENSVHRAHSIAKEKGVLCGVNEVRSIFKLVDKAVTVTVHKHDGERVKAGDVICIIRGPIHSILKCERVALNYIGYLSGISTATDVYVQAIKGTNAKIYDTRKTTPGYRLLEKYAVLKGGGCNQRIGLYDQVLIKDNHLKVLGNELREDLANLIRDVRKRIPQGMKIEVEADSIAQLRAILPAHPDIILLDNMRDALLEKAIHLVREENKKIKGHIEIEASGGITIDNVREIAKKGVDRISIGAITHSTKNLDFSLEVL